ncbi:hypothetical protein HMPREF1985_00360 [Mitsuokella sp. oral taxon 131 str. W9106]|nr:hypothetical protein HMPREF1985_00360 [Mitsuokella sp. oral taxon 131 str. W9106]
MALVKRSAFAKKMVSRGMRGLLACAIVAACWASSCIRGMAACFMGAHIKNFHSAQGKYAMGRE